MKKHWAKLFITLLMLSIFFTHSSHIKADEKLEVVDEVEETEFLEEHSDETEETEELEEVPEEESSLKSSKEKSRIIQESKEYDEEYTKGVERDSPENILNDGEVNLKNKEEYKEYQRIITEQHSQLEINKNQSLISPYLISVGLIEWDDLNASYLNTQNDNPVIQLTYEVRLLLELNLFPTESYVIFNVPSEIFNNIQYAEISYKTLLGRDRQEPFNRDDLDVLDGNNIIYMRRNSVLETGKYTYTLTLELEDLPIVSSGKYNFFALKNEENIIDIGVLQSNGADAALESPPPNSPIIHPVYSNDLVISGTGLANTTIFIEMNGIPIGSSTVDATGNFSVEVDRPLIPNATITAYLQNDQKSYSEVTETTVIEEKLIFKSVAEHINFEPTVIGSGVNYISRNDDNHPFTIEIEDTRRNKKPYKITAKLTEPLTGMNSGHVLPGKLIFKEDVSVKELTNEHPVKIYPWNVESGNDVILTWGSNEGPLVKMDNTNGVYADTYETTIIWTLEDAP